MSLFTLLTHISFTIFLVLISFIITWIMCHKVEIMDPVNERSSHSVVVPRGGGISIVAAFFIGMIMIYFFADKSLIDKKYMHGFLLSALIVAAVSLYDDFKSKSVLYKVVTQFIAIFFALWSGVYLDEISLPFLGLVNLGWFGYVISFIWIFGLTNAYNFMDGLDGLIGGVTVIAGIYLMGITYYEGSNFVYISSYTLVAGALGFLIMNMPPARIFMGDVGSAFLGFVFAVLAIIASRYDSMHTSFLVVPLLLFNVIYDVTFTMGRRLLNGENITQAHNKHLYQLVNQIGYTHLEVSLMQYCMVFLQGLGAFWMLQISNSNRIFVFLPFVLVQILYTVLVIKKAKKKDLLNYMSTKSAV